MPTEVIGECPYNSGPEGDVMRRVRAHLEWAYIAYGTTSRDGGVFHIDEHTKEAQEGPHIKPEDLTVLTADKNKPQTDDQSPESE